MDRNLGIEFVRVTEYAALAGAEFLGKGNKNDADQAAVDAMRRMFDNIDINGEVVIGEGELDEAPMLYIGEKIGKQSPNSPKVDVAVDPLDGTSCVAKGLPGSLAVLAITPKGCLLNAPDMYMDKIAVGPKAKGVIDINLSPKENIQRVSKAIKKPFTEMTITTIDRDRSKPVIEAARELGCRVKLFDNGDVETAIATCFEDTGVDMMMCIGGAPEGVIGAAAVKCLEGDFQARLIPQNKEEEDRCIKMGHKIGKKLFLEDLVAGNEVYFAATAVSEGQFLKGVKYKNQNLVETNSIVMRSSTGTVRYITSLHRLDKKDIYSENL